MRTFFLLSLSCLLLLSGCSEEEPISTPQGYESEFPVEAFIRTHLLTENGLLRTNITDRDSEFLSESLGLYLLFLVERNRKQEFSDQVTVLTDYFLNDSNLIAWRLEQKNDELITSPVNAWIDDARIVRALYLAARSFDEPAYEALADKISASLSTIATNNGLPVDFVDLKTGEASDVITLSYLDEPALALLSASSPELYSNSKHVLVEAPTDGPFFAKTYAIKDQSYTFDQEINMIDQMFVALRYEQFNLPTDRFYLFFKEAFDVGPVYGRYDRAKQTPTVSYESQAVYALAVFYLLEREEVELAERVMKRLQDLAVQETSSDYHGGYIDELTRHTHSFDNLLPLLAEGRLLDGYIVP